MTRTKAIMTVSAAGTSQARERGLPAGVRARVWVEGRHFFSRADAGANAWLWLLRDDGRVQVLRMASTACGRDDRLAGLVAHLDANPDSPYRDDAILGTAWPLPAAPAVPVPRWAVSWGHPLQRAIRAFAAQLDDEVLAALGRLEVPGPFFGSAGNYSRLTLLPAWVRRRRVQALELFPPLVAPLLLDVHGRPDLFGMDENRPMHTARLRPDVDAPLLAAIDHGRDLIGALAGYYRVDRALVRSRLFREPWAVGSPRSDTLQLLHAIPANARPRSREAVESRLPLLDALPCGPHAADDVARLAGAFARGWDRAWRQLERDFQPLHNQLRDSRDFLRAALEQAGPAAGWPWLDAGILALGWIARRGLPSLLKASQRWHAQPLQPAAVADGLPDAVLPLFDVFEGVAGRAIELVTRQALHDEGERMHHCVGDYWDECVLGPMRIVHLELPDGRSATAQYDSLGYRDDPYFDLSELRGPCNAACADDMHALAGEVRDLLNSPAYRERCLQAIREAAHARTIQRPGFDVQRRPLDRRSRDELRQVLAYCAKQADWQARPGELFRGPVAGFAYADGPRLLACLAAGDALQLVREPANPHDPRAVRIDWNGRKLGYVPRRDNGSIAGLLDAGIPLAAGIAAMHRDNAWAPVHCIITRRESARLV